MSYLLNWTDSSKTLKTSITVNSSVVDITSTPLTLIGRGYSGFGKSYNENFLRLLENFASPLSPTSSTSGMVWYNSDSKRLNLNIAGNIPWKELAFRRIDSVTSPVSSPAIQVFNGDTWFDTVNKFLNVYNNSWSRLAYTSQTMGNYSVELPTSTTNNYVVALNPILTGVSYPNNFVGRFKVTNQNTGACTIDAGPGAISLLNDIGTPLLAGDLPTGKIITYIVVVDSSGTHAYVLSSISSTSGYAPLQGSSGLTFSVANPVNSNDAINLSTANNAYAAKGGSTGIQFSVATANHPTDALPLGQADTLYAPLSLVSTVQSTTVPSGTIIDFAGLNPPAGYLACPTAPGGANQIITRAPWNDALFNALHYIYGGNGNDTFGIPWFPVGYTAVAGSVAFPPGVLIEGENKAHIHTLNKVLVWPNTGVRAAEQNQAGSPEDYNSYSTGTDSQGSLVGNMAAGLRVLKCIKI